MLNQRKKNSFYWLYFGSDNLVREKYQIKFREYEYKTIQMCTGKHLDYLIRTRVGIISEARKSPE